MVKITNLIINVIKFFIRNILLALVFFLIISPISLTIRLIGIDLMRQKIKRNKNTFWINKKKSSNNKISTF